MSGVTSGSEEDDPELVGLDFFALHDPVVKVVVQVSVSNLEVQVLEHCCVVHQIQAVVHVVALLLGQN